MLIQINYADIESSDALAEQVNKEVAGALEHVVERITRVEVHLHDDKQKRRGPDDKRCTMEARPAGDTPLAVEARGRDIYVAIAECAEKLQRAVTRRLERQDER